MCATTPSGRGFNSWTSAATNFAPRCACVAAPNSWTRAFSGTASGAAESQSTTSSSTRAASARTIGTVAPSIGSRGVELLRCEDQPAHLLH